MATGLILEGGAMRGLFTAGVLDVLTENSITFDGMIGVSAGAAFGSNFKSGQKGRTLRYNLRFCKDARYCSFRSLLRTGDLYGADFCYRQLPEELDRFDMPSFLQNPMAFYVVCTDLSDGRAIYQRLDETVTDHMAWYRASASMPLVSRPVRIGERELLDGGIADSIPLAFFESIGYDRNVLILTQPEGYQKRPGSLLPLMRLALKKYPAVYDAMARRHEVYNQTLELISRREQEGSALVIRPPCKLEAGHIEHDRRKLQTAYDLGQAEGKRRIEDIRHFIRK